MVDSELKITKETEIIIYGAGALGEILYKILKYHHYKIVGFVDKRHKELKRFQGLNVWSIEECPVAGDKVVIVAIKDVYIHDEIASCFSQKGIRYILYKPLSVVKGKDVSETEKRISSVYEQLIGFKYMDISATEPSQLGKIPPFEIRRRKWTDEGLIKEEKDTVISMMPVEMLFSAPASETMGTEWDDKSVFCLIGHIRLFDYFGARGGNDNTELYFSFCRAGARGTEVYTSEAWEMSLLETRYHVWSEMQKMLEFSPTFFQEHPTEGKYNNDKKIINLLGGRHRATFLLSKGYNHIPVKLHVDDYEKFINAEMLYNIIKYIEETHINILEVPISHPFFYNFPAKKESYVQAIIRPILEIIAEEKLGKKEVVLYVNDYGVLKRLLTKMGFFVHVAYHVTKMEQLLDKLFYYRDEYHEQMHEKIYIMENTIEKIEKEREYCSRVFCFSKKNKCEEILDKSLFSYKKIISETYWADNKIALAYMRGEINDGLGEA